MPDIILPTSDINGGDLTEAHPQHSIFFFPGGDLNHNVYNTWYTWHLVPTTRPVVNPPKVRTEYVTAPTRNGYIDFTEDLDGIHYDNRTGSWEFAVGHEYHPNKTWLQMYHNMHAKIHGKSLKVCLSDDPAFYYSGRIFVNSWKSSEHYSTITIDYDLYPFKVTFDSVSDATSNWKFNHAAGHRGDLLYYNSVDFFNRSGGFTAFRDYFLDGSGSTGIDFQFISSLAGASLQVKKFKENSKGTGGYKILTTLTPADPIVRVPTDTNATRESPIVLTPGRNRFYFVYKVPSGTNLAKGAKIGTLRVFYSKGASL